MRFNWVYRFVLPPYSAFYIPKNTNLLPDVTTLVAVRPPFLSLIYRTKLVCGEHSMGVYVLLTSIFAFTLD